MLSQIAYKVLWESEIGCHQCPEQSQSCGPERTRDLESQGNPFMFWQQLRQHESSGTDLEEKEEMDTAEGEPRTPGVQTPGPLHPRQCLLLPALLPGLGSKDQAKDLLYSSFHSDQFSNHSTRQTRRTIDYLSRKRYP